MGRKHCGKRRNCSLQANLLFPTVFSKGFIMSMSAICNSGRSMVKVTWAQQDVLGQRSRVEILFILT